MFNRVRSDNAITQFDVKAIVYWWNQPNTEAHTGGWWNGIKRTMWDVVNKDFSRASRRGGISNTPMRSVNEVYRYSPGTRTVIKTTPPAYVTGTAWKTTRVGNNGVGSTVNRVDIDISEAITAAATLCLSRVESPAVEGLPVLAELRETIQTLRNPLLGISRTIDALKKPACHSQNAVTGASERRSDLGTCLDSTTYVVIETE